MMSEVITHEGVQYRKVDREARVGDKVVVVATDETRYAVGDVFTIVSTFYSDLFEQTWYHFAEGTSDYLYRSEYATLEPLPAAMPKLTDAKPGDRVRITKAYDIEDEGYGEGDILTVVDVFDALECVGAEDADGNYIELYAEEFEVVRDYNAMTKASDDQIALHEANKQVDDITSSLRQGIIGQSRVSGPITLAELVDEVTQYDPTTDEDDLVNSPQHYNAGRYEVIDIIDDITKSAASAGASGFETYMLGNILKYTARYRHKNGVQDLRKAAWYLDRMIAELEAEG